MKEKLRGERGSDGEETPRREEKKRGGVCMSSVSFERSMRGMV